MKIALTGGIACGKTLFSRMLKELGVETLDADAVVHTLEEPGGAAVEPIVARFGAVVRAPDGGIDRAALARIVFSSEAERRALEAILHPQVRSALDAFASQPSRPSSPSLFRIAEIPLLFECNWASDYDTICALVSSSALQVKRLTETRGLSRDAAEARLAAQLPVVEKAARADYVVWNDSTLEHLQQEAEKFVAWLKSRRANQER